MKTTVLKVSRIGNSRGIRLPAGMIGKTRPAVIVSLDVLNERLETVVVCALTRVLRPHWQSRLKITAGGQDADICADQIRVVSKRRLGKKLGKLSPRDAAAMRRLLG